MTSSALAAAADAPPTIRPAVAPPCVGAGYGQPFKALFTPVISSLIWTDMLSSVSKAGQRSNSMLPRAMLTPVTSSLMATTKLRLQSPTQGGRTGVAVGVGLAGAVIVPVEVGLGAPVLVPVGAGLAVDAGVCVGVTVVAPATVNTTSLPVPPT